MQPFTAIGWLWHLSNIPHLTLGFGHWVIYSGLITVMKLAYASRRDSRRERAEQHARH